MSAATESKTIIMQAVGGFDAPSRVTVKPKALPALPKVNLSVQDFIQARLSGVAERPTPPPVAPKKEELEKLSRTWTGEVAAPWSVVTGTQLKPLQSTVTGEHSAQLLDVVMRQLAPQVNARYQKGERGYLFVWDVAMTLGCRVPRFNRFGADISQAGVCAWFRTQSTEFGWVRVSQERAQELAATGAMVVALPKARVHLLAVVTPTTGALRVASACTKRRGLSLAVKEAFGAPGADFFAHP